MIYTAANVRSHLPKSRRKETNFESGKYSTRLDYRRWNHGPTDRPPFRDAWLQRRHLRYPGGIPDQGFVRNSKDSLKLCSPETDNPGGGGNSDRPDKDHDD